MGMLEATLCDFRAEWHVEDGLITARIPQPAGEEVRMVVEALPTGGWDWTVWLYEDAPGMTWEGRCETQEGALLAAQRIARLVHLAPGQMTVSTVSLNAVA